MEWEGESERNTLYTRMDPPKAGRMNEAIYKRTFSENKALETNSKH